jgi:hypothetical protein
MNIDELREEMFKAQAEARRLGYQNKYTQEKLEKAIQAYEAAKKKREVL